MRTLYQFLGTLVYKVSFRCGARTGLLVILVDGIQAFDPD